ncbi:hypothetical protein YPPY64_0709 [Yersinia pestis PY-64]|nr:hypothetical protein YPPY64_0709 [Yersinia pestis PY-64]
MATGRLGVVPNVFPDAIDELPHEIPLKKIPYRMDRVSLILTIMHYRD